MPEPRTIVGDKDIRSGFNETGSDIAENLFVTLATTPTEPFGVALPAGPTIAPIGVTMEAIPQAPTGGDASEPANRGDVQLRGLAVITASAAIAVGANVSSTAAGKAVTSGSGNVVAGRAVTAAGADLDLIEIELAGPGGGTIVP